MNLVLRLLFTGLFLIPCFLTYAQLPSSAAEMTAENINAALKVAYDDWVGNEEGANADYIPVLAEVPSDLFGISLCTVDGQTYDIGDTDYEFSIQSISKVFTLAMVIQKLGIPAIPDTIGVNATGRKFNSIIAIEDKVDRPSNSLVNAGAIATTSLIEGNNYDEKME